MSINRSARAFSVSTTDRNLTAHAGAVLIRAAAHAVGLGGSIAAHLHLKKRARGLTEAESILALTRWSQLLGSLDADGDMRAKRLRYRYLNVPALLVRSGRRLVLKLQRSYPLFDRFVAALTRLQSLPMPAS